MASLPSIRSIEDIRKIPFTTKADMRANYPFGLVAGDMREDGVRYPVALTGHADGRHLQNTIWTLGNLVARCLYMVGIRKTHVFQNSSGYGSPDTGFQYGANARVH